MNNKSRKIRIESTLKNHFEPKLLVVRDDSKQHEGHIHVDQGSKETHFYVKMILNFPDNFSKVALHRKVYELLDQEFTEGLHALELDLRKK